MVSAARSLDRSVRRALNRRRRKLSRINVGKDDFLESTVEVTVARSVEGFVRVVDDERRALLIVLTGGRPGQRVVLDEQSIIIGRGSGCSFVLQGDSISRQHARIDWNGVGHVLTDLGST